VTAQAFFSALQTDTTTLYITLDLALLKTNNFSGPTFSSLLIASAFGLVGGIYIWKPWFESLNNAAKKEKTTAAAAAGDSK
jgi:hypothetical protein